MAKTERGKTCFVVGQIGSDDSAERVHADWVFDEIITPVFSPREEFKVIRADKVSMPGLIDTQIISELLNAELVIADLTGLNPNAFYELGIRHVIQKPIIHMHLVGQAIPFDISLFRSLKFSVRRPVDIRRARADLADMVESVLADDYEVENPVTNARGRIQFNETATPTDRVLLERLEAIGERVTALETEKRSSRITNALLLTAEENRRLVEQPEALEGPSFEVGDAAFHHKFGHGRVAAVNKNKITVDFEMVGRKVLLNTFILKI